MKNYKPDIELGCWFTAMIIFLLGVASIYLGSAYVAVHFILKFW